MAFREINLEKEGLTIENLERNIANKELKMLGLVLLDNPLKSDSE